MPFSEEIVVKILDTTNFAVLLSSDTRDSFRLDCKIVDIGCIRYKIAFVYSIQQYVGCDRFAGSKSHNLKADAKLSTFLFGCSLYLWVTFVLNECSVYLFSNFAFRNKGKNSTKYFLSNKQILLSECRKRQSNLFRQNLRCSKIRTNEDPKE